MRTKRSSSRCRHLKKYTRKPEMFLELAFLFSWIRFLVVFLFDNQQEIN